MSGRSSHSCGNVHSSHVSHVSAGMHVEMPLPELEQTIQGDKSELTALNARLTEIRAAVDGMPARDTAVRERLTELVERNAELESKLGLLAKTPQSGTEEEARQWSLQAGFASGLAEKAALDAEMLSKPMRLELLRVERFDVDLADPQDLPADAGTDGQDTAGQTPADTAAGG